MGDLSDAQDDPLAALANLFDVAVVFAVALLLALAAALRVPLAELASTQGASGLESAKPVQIDSGSDVAGGQGRRVGVAYRLESGAMVYVPDEKPSGDTDR